MPTLMVKASWIFGGKKMNGRVKWEAIGKKLKRIFTGGNPNHRTWPKAKKNLKRNTRIIKLPVYWDFAI